MAGNRENPVFAKNREGPLWLDLIVFFSSALNRVAAAVAAVLLTLMVALILVEIVLRFFSHSTFMADALVGYGVAAITFLALGWTLEQGSMIRVSVVTRRLPAKAQFAAEAFAIIATEVLIILLLRFQWRLVAKLWDRGSVSEHYLPIPLWIPAAIFFVGLLLLSFQLLAKLCLLFVRGLSSDAKLKI